MVCADICSAQQDMVCGDICSAQQDMVCADIVDKWLQSTRYGVC